MFHPKSVAGITVIAIITVLLSGMVYAQEPIVSDFAGTGDMGLGDGPLLKATFSLPWGMAFDRDGSLLVVDSYNSRIRKISGNTVSTLAGFSDANDSYGFPMAGYVDGEALKARFNKPRDIVVDSAGNIYVSDTGNNAIRKISGGKVYTFAGNGTAGYKDGNRTEAQFNCPSGLAIDSSDNVYVADSLNNVIRKITPAGEVSTFAGRFSDVGGYKDGGLSEARFNEPSDIEINEKGELFILDSGNQLVRKISDGQVTTLYGSNTELLSGTSYYQGGFSDGFGRFAKFNFPKGMTLADNDILLIADTWNHRIRAVTSNGKVITIAGFGTAGKENGSPAEAKFNGPADVLYKDGFIYIADMWNNCIRKMPLNLASLKQSADLSGIGFDDPKPTPQLWYNKTRLEIPEDSIYFMENKIMVPVEEICKAMGFTAVFDENKNAVKISSGDTSIEFTVNGEHLVIRNGKVDIQLRHLVEAFGLNIEWIQKYRAAVIYGS